jgi:hypothetical protein
MTNNELQLIRDRNSEIEFEKKMLEETKGLLLELEKDPKVQKYLPAHCKLSLHYRQQERLYP